MVENRVTLDRNIQDQRVQGPTKPLSEKEREILISLGRGLTQAKVASKFKITPSAVEGHALRIRKKLLERNTKDALARTLITGEIKTKEIFIEPDETMPEKLWPSEAEVWAEVSLNVGNYAQHAKKRGVLPVTISEQMQSVFDKIGAKNYVHATAIFFARLRQAENEEPFT